MTISLAHTMAYFKCREKLIQAKINSNKSYFIQIQMKRKPTLKSVCPTSCETVMINFTDVSCIF